MTTSIASYSPGHTWRRSCSRESIYSIQGHETDVVRDTTDTESDSDKEGVEYEPVTDADDDLDIDDSSGVSDNDIIRTRVIEVSVGDDGELLLADSERAPDSSDSELDYHDYWHCASCRATNNDPAYRYCQKCFKVRKNLFPPRPRRKAKRVEPPPQLSQDSGIDMLNELTQSQLQKSDLTHSQSEFTHSQSELTHSQSEFTHSQSELTHSQSEFTHSQSELTHSQSEFTHSQSEFTHSQSELTHSQSELSQSQNVRKRKHSADTDNAKRSRVSQSESESDSDAVILTPLHKTMSDPAVTIDHKIDSIDPKDKSEITSDEKSDMCITCLSEPKSGVFVHGRIAHICCCYKCAIKVWRKAKRCPICNSKVSNVLKAVVM